MENLIYVLEDDESIRELISYTLNSSNFKVSCFETSQDMFDNLKLQKPRLILLDIMLPSPSKDSGLDVLKQLKFQNDTKNIPVIFVTAKSKEIDKALGLDTGADDYITKPFGVLELVSRVKAVLRRYINTEMSTQNNCYVFKDLLIDLESKQVFKNKTEIKLTFKEYELFLYLYKHRGVVVTRDRLLTEVWGNEFYGETRTVDVHIRSLRQKLNDNAEDPTYISTIRGYGYKFIKE